MRFLPKILGGRAEHRAARLLRRQGYRILDRNVRCGRDEIDILARHGTVLVVVEVRRRARGVVAADLSIDRAKAHRLRRALTHLMKKHRLPLDLPVRFDLVLMGATGDPVHLVGVDLGS